MQHVHATPEFREVLADLLQHEQQDTYLDCVASYRQQDTYLDFLITPLLPGLSQSGQGHLRPFVFPLQLLLVPLLVKVLHELLLVVLVEVLAQPIGDPSPTLT